MIVVYAQHSGIFFFFFFSFFAGFKKTPGRWEGDMEYIYVITNCEHSFSYTFCVFLLVESTYQDKGLISSL